MMRRNQPTWNGVAAAGIDIESQRVDQSTRHTIVSLQFGGPAEHAVTGAHWTVAADQRWSGRCLAQFTTPAVSGAKPSKIRMTSGGALLIAARWIGKFLLASNRWHSVDVANDDPGRCTISPRRRLDALC